MGKPVIYCLDTSAFMQAWNSYYSPALAETYWTQLDQLAKDGLIFCPIEVKREIQVKDDGLKGWIKDRDFFFRDITLEIQQHLRDIMAKFPRLVDSTKQRSVADPWVIAYAIHYRATVVTNEIGSGLGTNRIKIPDVCKEFNVPCINEFEFVKAVGIRFNASIKANE